MAQRYDFKLKQQYIWLPINTIWLPITYTPPHHSPQIYTHLETAGFRCYPIASYGVAFVEITFEGDVAVPRLNFTAASP